MTSESNHRFQQLKQLYDELSNLPDSAKPLRSAELEKTQPVLWQELQSLLEAQWPDILKAHSVADFLPAKPPETLSLPTAGELIDERYRIRDKIGSGARSTVFLGSDERLGNNLVALKFFHQSRGIEQSAIRAEISALARIRHSGVSGMVDAGVWHESTAYLVQQYWQGRTLRERLQDGPIAPAEALRILEKTAEILEAAHRVGVLHLDLKPENIILTGDGEVRVVDFGTAPFSAQTQNGPTGTPGYLAPEQLDGQPSEQSDVYALAKIAAELLDRADRRLRRALQQGWAPEASQRPANPRHFVERLRRAQQPLPRIAWIVAAALGIVLALGLTWSARRENTKSADVAFAQLTSLKGVEFNPVFSPDGNWLYFLQAENPRSPRRIMRRSLRGEVYETVSRQEAHYSNLAISPDNRWLAFAVRDGSLPELILRDMLTGAEKQIYRGYLDSVVFGPDATWLILGLTDENDRLGRIVRLNLRTGRIEDDLHLNGQRYFAGEVGISSDGRKLAFKRRTGPIADELLWVAIDERGQPTGQPTLLVPAEEKLYTPYWSPDGSTIYFLRGNLRQKQLSRVTLAGARQKVPAAGDTLGDLAVCPQTGRIAVVREREDSDVWRVRLPTPPAPGESALERIHPSTAMDAEPRYSPDGQQIAMISDRNGQEQLYLADRRSGDLRQLTRVKQTDKAGVFWLAGRGPLMFARTDLALPGISAIPGEQAAYSVPGGIRVAGVSRDGRWLYTNSEDSTQPNLEKVSLDGTRREAMGAIPAAVVKEGDDGRTIFWAKRSAGDGLYYRRQGGDSHKILPRLVRRNLFAFAQGWLYYVAPDPELGLYAKRVQDAQTVQVLKLDKMPGWGMDVTPDGRELLITLMDYSDADIFLTNAGAW